jgi:hypothetical protein
MLVLEVGNGARLVKRIHKEPITKHTPLNKKDIRMITMRLVLLLRCLDAIVKGLGLKMVGVAVRISIEELQQPVFFPSPDGFGNDGYTPTARLEEGLQTLMNESSFTSAHNTFNDNH